MVAHTYRNSKSKNHTRIFNLLVSFLVYVGFKNGAAVQAIS
jgi:hypothetical protein